MANQIAISVARSIFWWFAVSFLGILHLSLGVVPAATDSYISLSTPNNHAARSPSKGREIKSNQMMPFTALYNMNCEATISYILQVMLSRNYGVFITVMYSRP